MSTFLTIVIVVVLLAFFLYEVISIRGALLKVKKDKEEYQAFLEWRKVNILSSLDSNICTYPSSVSSSADIINKEDEK